MSTHQQHTGTCPVIRYSQERRAEYYNLCDPDDADVVVDVAGDDDVEGHKELDGLRDTLKPHMKDATVTIVYSEYEGEGSPPRSHRELANVGDRIKVLHLTGLHLEHNGFWIHLPRWFPALTDIVITDIDMEPRDLVPLSRCPRLKRVGLHRSNATASHFAALAREGTTIETVCLLDNDELTTGGNAPCHRG